MFNHGGVPKHSELEPDHGVAARNGRTAGVWDSRCIAAFELASNRGQRWRRLRFQVGLEPGRGAHYLETVVDL